MILVFYMLKIIINELNLISRGNNIILLITWRIINMYIYFFLIHQLINEILKC